MTDRSYALPQSQALSGGLSAAFGQPLAVLDRAPNAETSTFPSEIVTLRLEDGSERQVFCKYGAGHIHHRHGHRGGVAYEAAVYGDLLGSAGVPAPAFYGSYIDSATGDTWLFLEYLPDATRVKNSLEPGAMALVARWLGWFHRAFEGRSIPKLNAYDADYYRGWAARTAEYACQRRGRFPWFDALVEAFTATVVPELCRLPATVIHGELYPGNVLICNGAVRPIDWESAATAPGEIDFASLIENWPPRVADECAQAYRELRWPDGAPANFDHRLAMVRMYWVFRWVGWRPERVTDQLWEKYLEKARTAAVQFGLII